MSAKRPADRLEVIDALRGFAAFAVLLYHARIVLWAGPSVVYAKYGWHTFNPDIWLGYLSLPFRYGGLGVTLFFVLSGYCIHRPQARRLAADSSATLNLPSFARRRFWRIYPTYLAALLLSGMSDYWLGVPDLAIDPHDNSPFGLIVSLLSLQGFVTPQYSSNGVFWTLAIEMHFYLVYPLLYWINRRLGAATALGLTAVAQFIYLALAATFDFQFPLASGNGGPVFLSYWFTWGLGMYLADAEFGRTPEPGARLSWLALIAGIGFTVAAPALRLGAFREFASGTAAGAVVWLSLTPAGSRMWDGSLGRGLARLGLFSYSLYAIHVPVLHAVDHVIRGDGAKSMSFGPCLLGIAAGILGGWLLFVTVEQWSVKKTVASRPPP